MRAPLATWKADAGLAVEVEARKRAAGNGTLVDGHYQIATRIAAELMRTVQRRLVSFGRMARKISSRSFYSDGTRDSYLN